RVVAIAQRAAEPLRVAVRGRPGVGCRRTGKPLMIHNRQADRDVLDVLRAEGAPDTVILHCFLTTYRLGLGPMPRTQTAHFDYLQTLTRCYRSAKLG
ncbi:TatD family hydrolase, partial [Mycobacterium tuberculosis]